MSVTVYPRLPMFSISTVYVYNQSGTINWVLSIGYNQSDTVRLLINYFYDDYVARSVALVRPHIFLIRLSRCLLFRWIASEWKVVDPVTYTSCSVYSTSSLSFLCALRCYTWRVCLWCIECTRYCEYSILLVPKQTTKVYSDINDWTTLILLVSLKLACRPDRNASYIFICRL